MLTRPVIIIFEWKGVSTDIERERITIRLNILKALTAALQTEVREVESSEKPLLAGV